MVADGSYRGRFSHRKFDRSYRTSWVSTLAIQVHCVELIPPKMTAIQKKRALICGSIAFDTIMVFQDRFKNHILPDKIHMLNVSFLVPQMRREYGGCAGNIAYNLRLLGDQGTRWRRWVAISCSTASG